MRRPAYGDGMREQCRIAPGGAEELSMKHATDDALDRLEPLLRRLRAIDGLRERTRGTFTNRSRAFLHFHEDPAGLFADVRLADDFDRHEVTTAAQQRRLATAIERHLAR